MNPLYIEVDEIYHLASPASPPHYMYNPVKTIKTNTVGTVNALGLAKRVNAKILIASTSEVYGDPEVMILIYFSIKAKHVINIDTYYKLKTKLNPFQLLWKTCYHSIMHHLNLCCTHSSYLSPTTLAYFFQAGVKFSTGNAKAQQIRSLIMWKWNPLFNWP